MAQLICGGCRTLLMYTRSADTVRCSCCNTVNLVRPVNNIAHVNCGHCQTTLMYPYGAHSVKCAICNHVTTTGVNTVAPTPSSRPVSNGSSYSTSSTSAPKSQPQNVTVVVENPMTVDDKGKLVSSFLPQYTVLHLLQCWSKLGLIYFVLSLNTQVSNVVVGVTTGKN
ncbi:unnamed protein product [Urochloa decumbens]|uniref:Zinc finger LSD1-type domain-containing protein n=1 Tax=Urochloa decumbens TaxID=240449 RepID=A0ABC8WZX6_9POAL